MALIASKKFRVPTDRDKLVFSINVDKMKRQERNLRFNLKMHEPLTWRLIQEDTSNNYDENSTCYKGDYWWNFN